MKAITDNEVRLYQCNTWNEFITEVRKKRFGESRIFRGQRDSSWRIASPWERLLNQIRGDDQLRDVSKLFEEGAHDMIRDDYLNRFRDLSIGLPGFQATNLAENDWWAIGRHHGLITPLLDWTKSPYVAAFFAFSDYADNLNPGFKTGSPSVIMFGSGSIAIWELVLRNQIQVENELEILTTRNGFAYRQKAQQGLFTRLTHGVHLDLEVYLKSRGLAHYLAKYELPGQAMGKALWDLHLMNINAATLFPDLDGAAAMANLSPTINGFGFLHD